MIFMAGIENSKDKRHTQKSAVGCSLEFGSLSPTWKVTASWSPFLTSSWKHALLQGESSWLCAEAKDARNEIVTNNWVNLSIMMSTTWIQLESVFISWVLRIVIE